MRASELLSSVYRSYLIIVPQPLYHRLSSLTVKSIVLDYLTIVNLISLSLNPTTPNNSDSSIHAILSPLFTTTFVCSPERSCEMGTTSGPASVVPSKSIKFPGCIEVEATQAVFLQPLRHARLPRPSSRLFRQSILRLIRKIRSSNPIP